jgi:hypothetical protein
MRLCSRGSDRGKINHSHTSELQAIQHYRYSTRFPVHRYTHALEFSDFTSRILATDLSQSRCHFNSHMKSSLHCLIFFLPFLQLPIPKTRPDCSRLLFYSPFCTLLVLSCTGPTENTVFGCQEWVFTALLPSIRRSTVPGVCFAGMFTNPLPSNGYTRHNINNMFT